MNEPASDPLSVEADASEKTPVNWNMWIRQTHRWLSISFTAIVVAIFVAMGVGQKPSYWVYLSPLLPLALLALTGLYLFVLPYAAKWRSGRAASARRSY